MAWHINYLLFMSFLQVPLCRSDESADKFLSEVNFPGLHILERVAEDVDGQLSFRAFREGQRPANGAEPLLIPADSWKTMEEARHSLEHHLKIPPLEELQTPWALFTSQGQRIELIKKLKETPVIFLLEIGQWMWPAVSVGHEQMVQGVGDSGSIKLKTLSLRPVVFEVEGFISHKEGNTVIELAKNRGLVASKGVLQTADLQKGTAHSEFRTSKQTWLSSSDSNVVQALDDRVAALTRVPTSHNEAVQVLRYDEGQYYHAHMDWGELELVYDQPDLWRESHFGWQDRMATVFWYLTSVEKGGETIFPKHGQPICPTYQERTCPGADDPDMESCEKGLKVKPKRGSVILWYNYHPSGRGDRNALHAGCPVEGNTTKWSGNKWVRIKPFNVPRPPWIDNHPALKRFGWQDTASSESNDCIIVFHNAADEPAELLWISEDGDEVKLATIRPKSSSSQNSYLGHRFRLQVGQRLSNSIECEVSGDSYTLHMPDFELRKQKFGRQPNIEL